MESKKLRHQPSLSYINNSEYGKAPKIRNPHLQCLGAPHVDSFNYLLKEGLEAAIADLIPVEFELPNNEKMKLEIEDAVIAKPSVPMEAVGVRNQHILPTECRQRAGTYKADLKIRLRATLDGRTLSIDKSLGSIPIMVKSNACHLADMSPQQLVEANEHVDEWGGYFLVKGQERLVRMLVVTRRNYPVAIKRPSWKMRGNLFSDYGVLVRSVQDDQTSTNNVLHFINNGTAKLMFIHRKMLYYAPIILIMKCLVDYTDHHIFKQFVFGKKSDLHYVNCIQNMLRELHSDNLHTSKDCKEYLGKMFRAKFYELPPWMDDEAIADFILDRCILVHLKKHKDKFNFLVFMTQKLFDVVQSTCKVEGADSVMVQELLLGGHLYLQILKERLQTLLFIMKANILKKYKITQKFTLNAKDLNTFVKQSGNIETRMESFLATGNAPSSGVNLHQYKGLTIIAENINRMRYMSHFKAIHRGAFFMEMRTTEARQLLPDAWGFVCPVHTPDGAPCGLLNHLTMSCQVTTTPDRQKLRNVPMVLANLGMESMQSIFNSDITEDVYKYPVLLDGRLIGYLAQDIVYKACNVLRIMKVKGEEVPITLEIVVIPHKTISSQYPGVFLFASEARMMRPVMNRAANQLELIGTLEQVYLDIAVVPEEIIKGCTTHIELEKTSFLSNLAQLVPMPDCNQSPRNMYQCQMGKQTMGTPVHNWPTQAGTKMYRLQTPATPLFRPIHHDNIGLDDFPMGTNAIVAVISYTGYDMEDAMIINKSAYERGFAAGTVYKAEFIELKTNTSYFSLDPAKPQLSSHLGSDGLPHVGARLNCGDPYYSYFDAEQNRYSLQKYKGKEEAFVDNVRLCGEFSLKIPQKAAVVLRVQRNPSVGDKFASRAGQKGICSQKWPAEDLPFTESGLIPDIIFNPHGFPSRMTIAMMIESMAGKSAAMHGFVHDATPFRFNEKDTAINYFGRLLEAGGYNYYGTERMYSGVDGREMNADIFFGVIHYQRLRHMVSDKWQVRTTGPVDAVTQQPIKGRRRGGGVRFGEMERDALISHGVSFLLQDRLFHCSDKTKALICTTCGTLLGPMTNRQSSEDSCRLCEEKGNIAQMELPYIFKYFVTQLASVNINIKINCNTQLQIR